MVNDIAEVSGIITNTIFYIILLLFLVGIVSAGLFWGSCWLKDWVVSKHKARKVEGKNGKSNQRS